MSRSEIVVLSLIPAREHDVDDLKQFIFSERLDSLAEEQRFYLEVLVQVPNFGDHA